MLSGHIDDYVYVPPNKATRRDVEAVISLTSNGAFTFSFVRNPWERLVSAWYDKFKRVSVSEAGIQRRLRRCAKLHRGTPAETIFDANFAFFVTLIGGSELFKRDVHFKPQSKLLPEQKLTFLGRFEQYERDALEILQRLTVPPLPRLPHRNATPGRNQRFQSYYSPKEVEIITKLYDADIEKYGYTFE